MGVQGHQDLTLKSMEKSLEVITKDKLILLNISSVPAAGFITLIFLAPT